MPNNSVMTFALHPKADQGKRSAVTLIKDGQISVLPTIGNEAILRMRNQGMPTRNINLTTEMDQLVDAKIRSGQYANASEVLRAGLRALEEDEREDQARLEALRTAVQAGIDSGNAKGDVIGRIRERIRRRAEVTGRRTA
jgi:antitoxin ParD1/3/4